MRLGIIALVSIILIGVGIKYSMQYWVKPDIDAQKQTELAATWQNAHPIDDKPRQEHAKAASSDQTAGELFQFDPNTLDSVGFIRLGLKPKTTHNLLNWRRKGKHFYMPLDLKPLYNLDEKEYERLEPYISIAQ